MELPGAANGADVTQIGQRAIDRAQADRSAEQLLDAIADAQPGGDSRLRSRNAGSSGAL